MWKKFASALLVLSMVLTMLPMSVFAAIYEDTTNKVEITVEDGAEITKWGDVDVYKVTQDSETYYVLSPLPTTEQDSTKYYKLDNLTTPAGTLTLKSEQQDPGPETPDCTCEGKCTDAYKPGADTCDVCKENIANCAATATYISVIFHGDTNVTKYVLSTNAETTDFADIAPGVTEIAVTQPTDKEDAVYVGWSLTEDGSDAAIAAETKISALLATSATKIDLYPKWEIPELDLSKQEPNNEGNIEVPDSIVDNLEAAITAAETSDIEEAKPVLPMTVSSSAAGLVLKDEVMKALAAKMEEKEAVIEVTVSDGAAAGCSVTLNATMVTVLKGKPLPVPEVVEPAVAQADVANDTAVTSALADKGLTVEKVFAHIKNVTKFETNGLLSADNAPQGFKTFIKIPVPAGINVDNFALVHVGTMTRVPQPDLMIVDGFATCTVTHFSSYAVADGSKPEIQALAEEKLPEPGDSVADLTSKMTETSDKKGWEIDLTDIEGAQYIVYQVTKGTVHAINWNSLEGTTTTVGKGNGDSLKVWVLSAAPTFTAGGNFDDTTAENILATNK